MTEPTTRYELSFEYRTRELITGGLPAVVVVDADDGQVLAQSKPLPQNRTEWDHDSVEFLTRSTTVAVRILIQRGRCSSSPCPAFGHAWFDSFVCKKL